MSRYVVSYEETLVFETIVVDAEDEQDAINQYYKKLEEGTVDVIKNSEERFTVSKLH